MANPQIVVEMDADEAKMWQKFKRIENAEGGVEAALKAIGRAAKGAAGEQADLERAALRVLKSIETPQQRYNQQIAELNRLFVANKLTVDQFRAAVARVDGEYAKATEATREMSDATKEAAKQNADLEQRARRVIESITTPQQRYNQKIAELSMLYGKAKLTLDQYRQAVRQVEGEYLKTTQSADEAGEAMEDVADAAEETAESGSKAFGSAMLSQVKGLLGALGLGGGLAGLLGLINREYQAVIDRQAEAARQSMTAADAQIKFLRNLQPETEEERNQAIADVERLAMETGVSARDLYLRAGSAMSARGALSKEAAYKAVEASARLVPEDMGEGEDVAGAALDLMKVTGSQNAEAAVGFLMETVRRARLTKTGAVARNVVQPLIASMGRGDTEQEAAALFAAITTGAGDARGEQSGTAMATLAQQLSEELPDLPSTRARIEAVQKSPQLQQKIIPELKGEAKTKGVMEQLLTGKGGISAAYQEYLATMPGVEESAQSYRDLVGLIQGTEIQRTARFGRTLDATMEQLATADQRGARIGLVREKFGPILRQTGMGALDTQLESLSVRASGDDLADFLRSLEEQERSLRRPGGETWQRAERRRVGAEAFAQQQETRNRQADVMRSVIDSFGDLAPPAGTQKTAAADPQMNLNNQLLQEIRDELRPKGPERRPMPAASAAANTMNRE